MTTMLRRSAPSLWTRGICTPSTKDIADERLRQAADGFVAFKTKLMRLNAALRTHHTNMVRAEGSRAKVLDALCEISAESPIADLMVAGRESGKRDNMDGKECAPSYGTLQTNTSKARALNLDKYEQEMIAYVEAWEKTVSTRIYTELKHVKNLQNTWLRRETKVNALKLAAAKKEKTAKGEAEKDSVKQKDKIKRNEAKLRTARREYRRNLICVTLLIEEVTQRGWKDLVPLMIKIMNFDIDNGKESADLVEQLSALQAEMRDTGTRYGLREEEMLNGRLELLQEEDATEFVSPEDMEDLTLEPTIASVWSRAASSDSSHEGGAPVHPVEGREPQNTSQQVARLVASDLKAGVGPGTTGPPVSTRTEYPGYLPQSFMIVCGGEDGTGAVEDDLTTLTPYTRCERRISI